MEDFEDIKITPTTRGNIGVFITTFLCTFIILVAAWFMLDTTKKARAAGTTAITSTSDVIRLGGIVPLSGEHSDFGKMIKQAVELAQSEMNATNGIAGKRVEIVWTDGGCNGETAGNAADRLINIYKVAALFGGACTSEFASSAPLVQQSKILSFSSSATGAEGFNLGSHLYRLAPPDEQEGTATAQYAFTKLGARKAAVATSYDAYMQTLAKAFSQEFTRLGGTIESTQGYGDGYVDESVAEQATAAKSDIVYMPVRQPADGLSLVQALRRRGVKTILSNDVLMDQVLIKNTGSDLEGVYGMGKYLDPSRHLTRHFLDQYKAKYSEIPENIGYAAGMYDAACLIKAAYEKTDATATGMGIYLHSLRNWEGAMGDITFDDYNDVMLPYRVVKISGGNIMPVDIYRMIK